MHLRNGSSTEGFVDSAVSATHHEATNGWSPDTVIVRTMNKPREAATDKTIPGTQVDGPVEQSFAQSRLWFLDRLYSESTWYIIPVATRLRGPLHLDALKTALLALEERHELLRTTFEHRDGIDLQVVHPFVPKQKQLKVNNVPGASWKVITQALYQERTTPFNLEAQPAWRTSLFRLNDEDHVLSIVMHQIISDEWSIGIIQRDLGKFYSAAVQGQAPPLCPLPIQYRHFAIWERQEAQAAEHERQLEYWKQQLEGSQPAELLCDKPRPTLLSGMAKVQKIAIDGDLYHNFQLFCKVRKATPFAVLLAVFRATHYRLTGVEDATIGTPIANRKREELEELIGLFSDLQCIRTTIEEDESFESLVRQVISVTAAASNHQDVPFEKIVAEVRKGPRDLSRNPLIQMIFAVHTQDENIGLLSLDGIETEPVKGETETSRFDLEFHLFHEDHRIHGYVLFSDDLFDRSSINCLTSIFFEILRRGIEESMTPLASMPLTDGLSILTDMGLMSTTRTEYPRNSSIPTLFRQQVAISGDSLAVKDASTQLTYTELDQRSDQLAYWLIQQDLEIDIIGVLAPRSCEAIIAFLGILKADLAYLPLDINVPFGRLDSILSTIEGKKLVLLGAEVTAPATQLKNVEFLPISATQEQQAATRRPAVTLPAPLANSLAYVMFTSGSTGQPKGVMIEHRGIVRLVRDTNVVSQSQAAVPVAHIANLAFDAATWEIYVALLNGGSLICIDYMTVLEPSSLSQIFQREMIRAAMLTPAFLKQCLIECPAAIEGLEVLFASGDRLDPQDARKAQRLARGGIINACGHTENSVYSTLFRMTLGEHCVNGVPVGRAISNSGAFAMDGQHRILPLGVMGELVLTGDGLARGYTNPALDRDRFVQVTVNGEPLKAYRTGDRVRYRPTDGQLEFFGRMDFQVKIRGHRIELAEVEQAFLRDTSVSDAAVLARQLDDAEAELVSFVTMQGVEHLSQIGEGQDSGEDGQVEAWADLFDSNTYVNIDGIHTTDLGRDFIGWTSMYDGKLIDRGDMNEWLDDTIAAIRSGGQPLNVCEIGTGTGMILFNLVNGIQSYFGLDPSASATAFVKRMANAMPGLAEKVDVRVGTAADIDRLGQLNSPDLVVINSVAQYFVSAGYLLTTIESLLRINSVERIFFGDIRSLAMYREFGVTKALHVLGASATVEGIRRELTGMQDSEEELLVDPAFFTGLVTRLPGLIEHVEILPKRMKATNELSCYRFAAVIYTKRQGSQRRPIHEVKEDAWIDFQAQRLDRAGLLRLLQDSLHSSVVAVSCIPNDKTITERHVIDSLDDTTLDVSSKETPDPLPSIRQAARHHPALSAYDLTKLAQEAGFQVEISWARQQSLRGGLDAIFHRIEGDRPLFRFLNDHQGRSVDSLTNHPLRRQQNQQIEAYLRAALKLILPSYMIPARITVLEKMPLNLNGKVDRRTLATLALGSVTTARGLRNIVAPRNITERALCEEFTHVLGLEIGITDNFFDLGGHSLMATRLASRINRRLNTLITIREVFACPTVADLAEKIEKSEASVYTSIPRTHIDAVEQSFAQGRLWFLDRLYPESTWYLMPIAARLRGPLHLDALNVALLALEERHETLRTTFEHRDGIDIQVVHPFTPKQLKVSDIPEANWKALTQALFQEHTTPFNLETEPGWRTSLFRLSAEDHVLSIVMHHIISDGWSVDILQRELARFYSIALHGQEPLLQTRPLPIQYRDFAVWQKQEAQMAEHERQLEYWKHQLDGSKPAELLYDKLRPTILSGKAKMHEVNIEGTLYDNLQLFCKEYQATPFAVLFAAFRATHYRLTGVEDATIGTPVANRNRQELEDLIGFFINLQCIRTTVKEEDSFKSLVRQVVETTAAASVHQDVPFERIVAAVRQGGPRDLSRNPLVQMVFAVHTQNIGHLTLDGVETEPIGETEVSRFDLEFHLFHEDQRIRGHVMFSKDLFDASSITCMVSTFLEILRRGFEKPSTSLRTIPLIDSHDLSILADMSLTNVTRTEYPRDSSVTALFRAQAAICGDSLAVKDASTQLTYTELDQKSDQVAYWLAKRDFIAETIIGVLAPRSCETVVAFLGILKANLAYLPLDVNMPLGRLQSILSTIEGKKLVLIGTEVTAPTPTIELKDVEFLAISATQDQQDQQVAAWQSPVRALPAPSPTSLAYVMFTSGSTGRPKGVMVEHRSIVRLVRDTNIAKQSQVAVPIAHIANIAFDAATWEIYAALLNGGSLICIDYMTVLDTPLLSQIFQREMIGAVMFTPALLKRCLANSPEIIAGLNLLIVAGDRVDLHDVIYALKFLHNGEILNAYGPTENTTFSTIYRIRRGENYVNGVPIGQAISNSGALVMDPQQSAVPLGIMGEIVLIGDGIARGYTDRVLDRNRFVQITLLNGECVKAYRTGDRARYRPVDGQLEFFGRMDYQVKIRGNRVELGEVEQALLRDDSVEDAVVLTHEHEDGDIHLISFVTIQSEHGKGGAETQMQPETLAKNDPTLSQDHQEKAEAHLRAVLQAMLPSYMVPKSIIILDKMPLNLNGKVDRRALASLVLDPVTSRGPRTIVPPRNTTERTLCEEFAHLLGLEVGITDSFFDLGGHSLMATRLISRINRRLNTLITIREIFNYPAIGDLANKIDTLLEASKYIPIPRTQIDGPVEQSFAQGRLWFLDRLYPESIWYLIPLTIRLRGPLQLEALNTALLALEERHEPLRTTFEHRDGTDIQIIHPFTPKKLEINPAASWEVITQALHQEHTTPFNLETEPGWRTSLFQVSGNEEDHVLSIVMHHIISDGWSVDILQRELGKFYSAAIQSQEPLLQTHPLPIQYRDFAVWQRQEAQVAEHERQLEYWKQQLEGSQPAELLCDKPRPAGIALSGTAQVHELTIEADLYHELQLFCKAYQATPFAVLLAVFRATHYRLTGVEDATIGTPIANRNREELEDLIGFFINLQCIRTIVKEGDESFESLVRQVVETTAAASAHQDVPFERIVAAVRQGPRDLSRNPLVQIVFAVHAQGNMGHLTLDGIEAEVLEDMKSSRFDLEFHLFHEDNHRIRGHVMFSKDLFEPSSISSMISTFLEILRRGLAKPAAPLATMPLTDGLSALTDMGLTQVAATQYPRDSNVPNLFRQQVAISGGSLAVKDATTQLTYAELDQRSDQLACWLSKRHLAPETMIGILAPRSCETIVAFLGILKANLAYLPLDINAPLGRFESILSMIQGDKLVLLGADITPPATQLKEVEFMTISATQGDQQDQQAAAQQSATVRALPAPSPTSLAYVMFTSGSTGRPKGVMVEHRGIVRLVRNTNVASQSEAAVPIAHIANLAFDAATWEIYAALLNGGSLICIDHMNVLDPACLGDIFLRESIGAAYFAPSLLKQLLNEMPSAISQLGVLVVGGEILRPQDALNAQRLVPGSVYNCYGNTENTGFTTIYRILQGENNVNGIPIGRTISNSGALVMDSQQSLVPLGVMGEIVLIGDGIARGYTDQALDRNRFVHITLHGESVKAYRTGDRARYRPVDGQLEFFGRMDYQVKIRGYRIEMAEVEQALLRDESVEDAIVLTREHEGEDGGMELVSFVTLQIRHTESKTEPNKDPTSEEYQEKAEAHLRAVLQAALPSYMIPSRIVILDKMPVNLNGKVDRRALAVLALGPMIALGPRTIVPPRNLTERAICEEFARVLGGGLEVGITDNFFDLGGHSLMATRLISRVKTRMGWAIILRDLYQHSTPQALCEEMTSRADKGLSPERSTSFMEVHARENSRATLVLIHGFWGSGNIFSDLVPLVEGILDVIVIHDPFFGSPEGPQTVRDWAVFYLTALKTRVPADRPVILGGYSFGGLIAFQMASVWDAWWSTRLASVILLDPGTFEPGDINRLDSTAIDEEVKYGLQLFGQDQEANVLQQLKKLGPLLLSMTERPNYPGQGLYVSTDETVETGVSEWWVANYPYLQTHHISSAHYTLLGKTHITELSQVINQHCYKSLKMLQRIPLDLAFRRVSKTIDVGQQSCEAVAEQIYQALIGVSNGIVADKLLFTSTLDLDTESTRARAEKGLARALLGPYRWAVRCYWVQDDDPVLIILSTRRYNSYKSSYSGLFNALSELEGSGPTAAILYRLAYELDNRSLSKTAPTWTDETISRLLSIAKSESILLSALAAEILTHQGIPTLPTEAITKSQQKAGSVVNIDGTNKHIAATFEKRISVDNYNFFELVHPAYFRQTVALATLVAKFVRNVSPYAIDVGPGPGTNLLAFQEMMPNTKILAIEPSDIAFHYLQGHFKGNANVKCVQEDFLTVPVISEKVDYIMSTGASHHFNTDAFLQHSMEWLRPGGYWFIADEMISAFETRAERSLNLLRHHLAYMAPLCFPWPATDSNVLTRCEREFVDDFNCTVPHAKFFADNGDCDAAEKLCRALLSRTERYGFNTKISDPRLAFWRLQWLELEALIAGLDYEVEQKTYPQHFIEMAEGAGLVCVAHERVLGTVGMSDSGAGTHVMAFQKT